MIGLGAVLFTVAGIGAQPQRSGPSGWEHQADRSLGVGRGVGRQLMTEDEWQAHHHEMQTLRGEEREKAERQWHERMQERAKERGVSLPATPGPHGPGAMGRKGIPPPRN